MHGTYVAGAVPMSKWGRQDQVWQGAKAQQMNARPWTGIRCRHRGAAKVWCSKPTRNTGKQSEGLW
ncbi:hypothetical protein D8674_040466 [Pyrus ussuriensis x Pyrus communis]|uniref:Uncharacterized protein n=1 Tax=Pyrus ussuriensis x Pyrus communis TaxID=2448454 RepID=A0A5N5I8B2_9ROSA|nr:hypothetical protein D8674_040466 [Pyrus ussuriensis x Pyrus communis]